MSLATEKMEFAEFDRLHRNQCRDDDSGWYEACYTLDGQKRSRRTVRACDPMCSKLGESVRNGVDGRLSGGIRRWSQPILSDTKFEGSSRVALMAVRPSTNDRAVTHAKCVGDTIDVYRRAPRGYILRRRPDADGRHVQMQLARPVCSASEFRQSLVDANLRGLAETARFSAMRHERYIESFLQENPGIRFEDFRQALRPRPGIFLVPLKNEAAASRREWQQSQTPLLVCDDPSVHACALFGNRTFQSSTNCPGTLIAIDSLVTEDDGVTAFATGGMSLRWQRPAPNHRPTAEDVRSYLIRLASPQTIGPPCHAVEYDVKKPDAMTVLVNASTRQAAGKSTLRCAPYRQKGGGFVFCTDEALRTGFPLTHRDRATTSLDSVEEPNDLDDACHITCDGDARTAMCATLKGLMALDHVPKLIVVDDPNPLTRARFAAILKMAPVVDDDSTLPEHEVLLNAGDEICLTPDEKNVRIRGKKGVVPLIHNVSPPAAFSDCFAFNRAEVDSIALDDLLDEPCEANTTHRLRKRSDDDSILQADVSLTYPWSEGDNLGHRRRAWRNRYKPLQLQVDRFVPLDNRRAKASGFSILTEAGVLFFDNCKHRDPRLLVLPQKPIYRATGTVASLMLRPMPESSDVRSMLDFCQSKDADALLS